MKSRTAACTARSARRRVGGQPLRGSRDFTGADPEIARPQPRPVKLERVVRNGGVTPHADVGENRGDRARDLLGHGSAAAEYGQVGVESLRRE